jgi:hypothetical protein
LYPRIDRDPKTLEELREIADQFVNWKKATFIAYGTLFSGEIDPSAEEEEEAGVIWHFWPSGGPFTDEHPSRYIRPLPGDLQTNPAAPKVMHPGLRDADGYEIDITLENWPNIRRHITCDRLMIVRQCQALVIWVREEAKQFCEAGLPEIFEEEDSEMPRNARRVVVRCDGIERTVELSGSAHHLLQKLSTANRARDTRKNKSFLCDAIPEIKALIKTVAHGQEQLGPTEAVYSLDQAVRDRIDLRD